MIDLQIGNPRPMPLDLVVKNGLKSCSATFESKSGSGICNRDHYGIVLIDVRFDKQNSRLVFRS